jgi:hypothetical protein
MSRITLFATGVFSAMYSSRPVFRSTPRVVVMA